MWRNGPLGYKTLCNACGIKYRKLKNKIQANIEAANN
ncbi:GATA domain-containing protein [Cephalotus follicularis]|uniref:GATA domain-containing protein n=1 Tax=Cephalotus follicularis TaxID=3775 RepID=A0A1Q3B598_CEPFO|nr:GATA domain-containing protein [Cephalotus follicularis]